VHSHGTNDLDHRRQYVSHGSRNSNTPPFRGTYCFVALDAIQLSVHQRWGTVANPYGQQRHTRPHETMTAQMAREAGPRVRKIPLVKDICRSPLRWPAQPTESLRRGKTMTECKCSASAGNNRTAVAWIPCQVRNGNPDCDKVNASDTI
jgi:hypothetical protein